MHSFPNFRFEPRKIALQRSNNNRTDFAPQTSFSAIQISDGWWNSWSNLLTQFPANRLWTLWHLENRRFFHFSGRYVEKLRGVEVLPHKLHSAQEVSPTGSKCFRSSTPLRSQPFASELCDRENLTKGGQGSSMYFTPPLVYDLVEIKGGVKYKKCQILKNFRPCGAKK